MMIYKYITWKELHLNKHARFPSSFRSATYPVKSLPPKLRLHSMMRINTVVVLRGGVKRWGKAKIILDVKDNNVYIRFVDRMQRSGPLVVMSAREFIDRAYGGDYVCTSLYAYFVQRHLE